MIKIYKSKDKWHMFVSWLSYTPFLYDDIRYLLEDLEYILEDYNGDIY